MLFGRESFTNFILSGRNSFVGLTATVINRALLAVLRADAYAWPGRCSALVVNSHTYRCQKIQAKTIRAKAQVLSHASKIWTQAPHHDSGNADLASPKDIHVFTCLIFPSAFISPCISERMRYNEKHFFFVGGNLIHLHCMLNSFLLSSVKWRYTQSAFLRNNKSTYIKRVEYHGKCSINGVHFPLTSVSF